MEPEERQSNPRLGKNPGFLRDVGAFLVATRKWWLIPIVLLIGLLGLLISLGGTAAAPFLYPLF